MNILKSNNKLNALLIGVIPKIKNEIVKMKKIQFPLILLLSIPILLWIALNKSVWAWDQSFYGNYAVALHTSLQYGLKTWAFQMLHAIGFKAPGISIIGQFFIPFGKLINNIDFSLLMSVYITSIVIVCINIRLVKLTIGKYEKMAALLLWGMPLFYGLTCQYFVEIFQTLAVSIFVLGYFMYIKNHKTIFLLWMIFALVLGMFIKVSTPLYLIIFFPLLGYEILGLIKRKKFFIGLKEFYNPLTIMIIGLFLYTIFWYFFNWKELFGFLKLASDSLSGDHYAFITESNFLDKVFYWIQAFSRSFFITPLFFILIVLGVIQLLIYFKKHRFKSLVQIGKIKGNIIILSMVSILLVLASFALNKNQETRYLIPLLPFVISICVKIYSSLGLYLKRLIVLLIIIQYIFVCLVSFGVVNNKYNAISLWVEPIVVSSEQAETYDRIIEGVCNKPGSATYNIGQYKDFNHNIFEFNKNKLNYFGGRYDCSFLPIYVLNAAEPIDAIDKAYSTNIDFLIVSKSYTYYHEPEYIHLLFQSNNYILNENLSDNNYFVFQLNKNK